MRYWGYVLLLVLGVALAAWAAQPVTIEQGATVDGMFDVAAVSTGVPTDVQDCGPRGTLNISPFMSNASATLDMQVYFGATRNGTFEVKRVASLAQFTAAGATGPLTPDGSPAPAQEVSTGGYREFGIVVTAISAGTAKVRWSTK